MPYATPAELIDRLGEREATAISDRQKTGQPDAVVLAGALAQASDEVDGYVGRRYALPLANTSTGPLMTPPSMLTRMTVDIARYRLSGTEVMETDPIRNRFKDAIRVLEQIADGRISLGDSLALAAAGGAASVGGNTSVRTPVKAFGSLAGVL